VVYPVFAILSLLLFAAFLTLLAFLAAVTHRPLLSSVHSMFQKSALYQGMTLVVPKSPKNKGFSP